jgi:hypothetical protein
MGRFPTKHYCYNLLVTWCFNYYRPVRDKAILALFFEQMFPFLIKLSVDFWAPIEKILGDRSCDLFLVCAQKCIQLSSTSREDPVTSFLAANIETARNKLESSRLEADMRETKKWFLWFADFCNVMDHPDAEPWLPESPKYNEECGRAHDELLDALSGLDHYLKLDKKGASKMSSGELLKMNADAEKLLDEWLRSATLAVSITVKVRAHASGFSALFLSVLNFPFQPTKTICSGPEGRRRLRRTHFRQRDGMLPPGCQETCPATRKGCPLP